jgi:hypothetical protein
VTATTAGGLCVHCARWKGEVARPEPELERESVLDVCLNVLASMTRAALVIPGGILVVIGLVAFDIGLLTALALVAGLCLAPLLVSLLWDGWP